MSSSEFNLQCNDVFSAFLAPFPLTSSNYFCFIACLCHPWVLCVYLCAFIIIADQVDGLFPKWSKLLGARRSVLFGNNTTQTSGRVQIGTRFTVYQTEWEHFLRFGCDWGVTDKRCCLNQIQSWIVVPCTIASVLFPLKCSATQREQFTS